MWTFLSCDVFAAMDAFWTSDMPDVSRFLATRRMRSSAKVDHNHDDDDDDHYDADEGNQTNHFIHSYSIVFLSLFQTLLVHQA